MRILSNNWVTEKETEFKGQQQEERKSELVQNLLIKYDNYRKGSDS